MKIRPTAITPHTQLSTKPRFKGVYLKRPQGQIGKDFDKVSILVFKPGFQRSGHFHQDMAQNDSTEVIDVFIDDKGETTDWTNYKKAGLGELVPLLIAFAKQVGYEAALCDNTQPPPLVFPAKTFIQLDPSLDSGGNFIIDPHPQKPV